MIGQTIAHYRVTEKLGVGGMGEVYRARDERLGREIALKLLPSAFAGEEKARARLVEEARTASALNHPHICTIHEVGEAAGRVYIAMELVGGKPLSALIPPGGLPIEAVIRYGEQIAGALAHAHDRHVVHRDLKTANVVITPEGRAKVLDFGLASRMEKNELDEVTRSRTELSEAGALAGTLQYLAPETLRGAPADARIDIWALGVVLHEMAAGELPFQGRTGYEVSSAILRESAAPLPARVPAGLRGVIERCLAKEPGQRYQRASEVAAALEAIRSDTISAAPVQAAAAGRRLPRWVMGAAYDLLGKADEAIALNQQFGDHPGINFYLRKSYLWKKQFDRARQINERILARTPDDPFGLSNQMLLDAELGRFQGFEAKIPAMIEKVRSSRAIHHVTYNIASVYALEGKTRPAVEWLKKTVETGMPNYTVFARDPQLDPIRKDPAFVTFLKELELRWEAYRREFR
jgi:tetratricopeptide (TPR) repeat protein